MKAARSSASGGKKNLWNLKGSGTNCVVGCASSGSLQLIRGTGSSRCHAEGGVDSLPATSATTHNGASPASRASVELRHTTSEGSAVLPTLRNRIPEERLLEFCF